MTVGMRRKIAVVVSARVAIDSDGVRCTGSLRCDHVGNSRCSLMRLARWIRVVFSHAMAPGNPSRPTGVRRSEWRRWGLELLLALQSRLAQHGHQLSFAVCGPMTGTVCCRRSNFSAERRRLPKTALGTFLAKSRSSSDFDVRQRPRTRSLGSGSIKPGSCGVARCSLTKLPCRGRRTQ